MDLIYMLPFFLNNDGENFIFDLKMANDFFKSLEKCDYNLILIYNQGCFSNEELVYYLSNFNVNYEIIGIGKNDGITFSRYSMINYVKDKYPNTKYIAEVHVDMLFTPDWEKPLIEFLKKTGEPMVCPRIMSYQNNSYKVMGKDENYILPDDINTKVKFMKALCEDKIDYGLVHPVIHNFSILKKINAYDINFLTGKQGYEDDSIILGYNYYLGTKESWWPKIYYKSCVYHRTIGQRNKINNFNEDVEKNLIGLKLQYGAYGQKELSRIYLKNMEFEENYKSMIVNEKSSLSEAKAYDNVINTSYKSFDIYESRYILRTDDIVYKVIYTIPNGWWSRFYEYAWASKFSDEEDIALDAGCGVIHPFKYYLASICKEVHAVDTDTSIMDRRKLLEESSFYFNEEEINLSSEYIDKIIFNNENLRNLSYEDNKFDKIYCISVLHSTNNEELREILKEFKRILKPSGKIIITVDVPTINIIELINTINEVGLKIIHNLDLSAYNGAIYSSLSDGLNCFRILVTK